MPDRHCIICDTLFYVKPAHLKLGYGKYCSINCRNIGQRKGKLVACDICGKESWKMPKELRRTKSGKLFCGKSCQTVWRNKFYSGVNHPFWKGGENVYKKYLLKSDIQRVCRRCLTKDERVLIVHHLDKDRKNNLISNLIWLCQNCHYLTHHYEIENKNLAKRLKV